MYTFYGLCEAHPKIAFQLAQMFANLLMSFPFLGGNIYEEEKKEIKEELMYGNRPSSAGMAPRVCDWGGR